MSDDHETLPDEPEEPEAASDAEGAPAEPGEPPQPGCLECGAPLEEGQPYCLECGAPTPAASTLRRRIGPAAVLAAGLLALGIGAGALAYASLKEDKTTAQVPTTGIQTSTTLPTFSTTFPTTIGTDVTGTSTLPTFPTTTTPTSPTATTLPTTTFTEPTTTFTQPTTTFTQPTVTTTPTTPTTPPSGDTWPDGVSGWTVILSSTRSQSEAAAFRTRVVATGRQAGLIESSLYATLEPDYWVVWTGNYASRTQAISQAATLRATYPGAYAARIAGA